MATTSSSSRPAATAQQQEQQEQPKKPAADKALSQQSPASSASARSRPAPSPGSVGEEEGSASKKARLASKESRTHKDPPNCLLVGTNLLVSVLVRPPSAGARGEYILVPPYEDTSLGPDTIFPFRPGSRGPPRYPVARVVRRLTPEEAREWKAKGGSARSAAAPAEVLHGSESSSSG